MIQELKAIKSTTKELKEFGYLVGGILIVLGGIALWRGKPIYPYFLWPGMFLMITAAVYCGILLPVQKIWMGFAVIIGFIMSRVVLTILFFLVMTPIGLIMGVLKKDKLERKIYKDRASYWIKRDETPKPKESYENQY